MKFVDQTIINVYNYADNPVSLSTHLNPQGYWFEPANNGNPSMLPLSYGEIRVVNGQSEVFRNGRLRFDTEIEEEIYELLKIKDWKNILTEKEIEDIILHPAKEGLDKIVAIKDLSSFDRIRGILVRLQNSRMYDISQRVIDIVDYRYQELYRNKRNTEIVITKTQQEMSEEIKQNAIAAEIERVRKDIEEQVRKEIEKEMKSKADNAKKSTPSSKANKAKKE